MLLKTRSWHLTYLVKLLSSYTGQYNKFNIVLAYLFSSPSFFSLYSIHPTWRWVCDFFFILFYLLFYFFFISPYPPPPSTWCVLHYLLPSLPTSSSSSWMVCCAPQPLGMPLESRTPLKVPHPNACKMGVRTWKGLQATGWHSSLLLTCWALTRALGQ